MARIRVLLIAVVAFTAIAVAFWLGARNPHHENLSSSPQGTGKPNGVMLETPSPASTVPSDPTEPGQSSSTTSTPPADSVPSPESFQSPKQPVLSGSFVGSLKLIIPVSGVRPEQLQDTFTAARSEGRAHDAIDIMSPVGTPVLAASDGEIVRLFQSERGGTTIYQLSPDKKLVFYYAHLQRYADGLSAGKFARQGEVIGYVGDTGNAGPGNYHLHFSIAVLADPKRYWEGKNINPYPLLRQ